MKYSFWIGPVLFCLMLITTLPQTVRAVPQDGMRRFAVVVGANDGGESRVRLRYAVSDARTVMKLFQKIGGVFPLDCRFLVEPNRETLLASLQSLQRKVRKIHGRTGKTEMIFYYSGHSDEESVLLGGEKVYYTEIKHAIEAVNADVRIAILDSCSSGAFTRIKGGKTRPPFLLDDANDMKGSAFLTSSSSDEVSQESDRLRSSFFTHYLVSGMRGAADMSQDGKVTLNEAYQYAYHETLMNTEKTMSGPQHPNYNIQMTGTGDVIMTDIRQSSAIMVFDKSIQGRIFIRDHEDRLVLEMRKSDGKSMQIGLEEGDNTISYEINRALYAASVHLTLGQELHVAKAQFEKVMRESTVARGNPAKAKTAYKDPVLFHAGDAQVVPWDFMLMAEPKVYKNILHHNAIGLLGVSSGKVDGISLAVGPNIILENSRGAQISAIGNDTGWDMQGAQIGGIYNFLGKRLHGVQAAGIFNQLGGDLHGVQTAGIFSICRGNVRGFQSSGVYNMIEGRANAGQFAGIFNLTHGPCRGIQAAGMVNIATTEMEGAQLSGGINIVHGKSRGVQIGIVNIADEQNGVPIGLVNLAKNGGVGLTTWWDNQSGFNLGAKFRAGHFYSIIAGNKKSAMDDSENAWGGGFYYGVQIPITQKYYVAADTGFVFINHRPTDTFTDDDLQMAQLRVMAGATFYRRLSVFGGVGSAYIYRAEIGWEKEVSESIKKDMRPLYLAGATLHF